MAEDRPQWVKGVCTLNLDQFKWRETQSFEEEEFGKMAKNWSVGADDVSY